MYIKVTDRCNMNCDHCAFACNSKGDDMSFEVFKKAVDMGDECITIGGGEPTLHPQIEKFILYAIGKCYSVFMVTNGTNEDLAMTLLELSKGMPEKFGVNLSMDSFHDISMVSGEVVSAYMEANAIRDVESSPSGLSWTGRAREFWNKDECGTHCVCEDLNILPDGRIKFCGCDEAPIIGNVYGWIEEEYEEIMYDLDERCWNYYLRQNQEDVA